MAGKKTKGPAAGPAKGGEFAPGGGRVAGQGKKEIQGKEGGAGSKSDRIARAKAAHVMVDAEIQRYAEHNEVLLAGKLGGVSFRTNEPADIAIIRDGKIVHGIELKTVVKNANAKITMKGEALARKRTWTRKNKATFHTVVLDDSKVFNANGAGVHDDSQRAILYRRGSGSFRLAKMYRCKDEEELKSLLDLPTKKLPLGAK